MATKQQKAVCPYCKNEVDVELPDGGVYQGATKTRKDYDHVHEVDCAMCDGHFYVHYTLN